MTQAPASLDAPPPSDPDAGRQPPGDSVGGASPPSSDAAYRDGTGAWLGAARLSLSLSLAAGLAGLEVPHAHVAVAPARDHEALVPRHLPPADATKGRDQGNATRDVTWDVTWDVTRDVTWDVMRDVTRDVKS